VGHSPTPKNTREIAVKQNFATGSTGLIKRENKKMNRHLIVFMAFLTVTSLCRAEVLVSNLNQLETAISAANSGGDSIILVADGDYELSNMLYITTDNVMVRSQSGNRDSVILKGQGLYGGVSHIFLIGGSHVTIQDMTLGWVANHAIQVRGEIAANFPVIRNLHIVDTFEQMVKISYDSASPNRSTGGVMENCLLEYSAGIGPQWYIGGVDGHFTRNWIVRYNVFKNIGSPAGDIAEFAVHFWSDSEDTLVEGNQIIDCDRGIGLGMGTNRGHLRGVIRNNMIVHGNRNLEFADVGISLESCPGAQVYNNSIFFANDYPNAIEYRFVTTNNVLIVNNLCNKLIRSRDGASAVIANNLTNALSDWFVDPSMGNLHLMSAISSVIDEGTSGIPGLPTPFLDFDRQTRPLGAEFDIGADEYQLGTLTLISPNGGEIWRLGEQQTITWSSSGVSGNLVIEVLQNTLVVGPISDNVPVSNNSYTWTVGFLQNGQLISGSNIQLRIRCHDGSILAVSKALMK